MLRPRAFIAVAAIALAASLGWAYSTSFRGVFVYDDGHAIVENPHIRHLWPITEAMSAPAQATVSGRPIASLSLAINYALAPADAREIMSPPGSGAAADEGERFYDNIRGYHLFNLLVHLAAALTLFGVVRRVLLAQGARFRIARHADGIALAVALIWIVHPINTQAVTYIVQRVESLMGLFYLLTLYCSLRALAASTPFRERAWKLAAVMACAAGMGSKEVMVSAPIMVWLFDSIMGADRRRRIDLYLGLSLTWIILLLLLRTETRPSSVGYNLGWAWWEYLTTQAAVLVHYMRLTIWPDPLVFDYRWPKMSIGQVIPQLVVVLSIFAATVYAFLRRHPAALLGACFFLILAPTSSVLPITSEVAAEHRMYLPSAAIIAGCVAVAWWALDRTLASRRSLRTAMTIVLTAGIVIGFAEVTRARNLDYSSEERLWLDTIRKRPANGQARIGYGIALVAQQRYAEAEQTLRAGVELEPGNALGQMNLGSALSALGKREEGVRHLELALEIDPTLKEPYALLGEAYFEGGQLAKGVAYFERAVEVMPDKPFLLARVAWLLATVPDEHLRNGRRAEQLARRALELAATDHPLLLDSLGAALAEQGRFPEAVVVARRAAAVNRGLGQPGFQQELEQRVALYEDGRKASAGR